VPTPGDDGHGAPNSFSADAIRTEKAEAIEAISPLLPQEVATNTVRGQYDAGIVGKPVNPYRQEPDSRQTAAPKRIWRSNS
jgi:glucose-6-phosphate 1-dehydrogenase